MRLDLRWSWVQGQQCFKLDPAAQLCFLRYEHFFKNSRPLFQYKIQIVTPGSIPKHILNTIASNLNHNSNLEYATEVDKAEAIQTYAYLDPYLIWGGSYIWESEDAPHSLRRLSHLVDLDEALAICKLPIPFHEGKATTIMHVERIERMENNTLSVQGDVNAPIIANFDKVFGNVSQILENSPFS